MSFPLGRKGILGLAIGATAGLGLVAIIVYREIRRRRCQLLVSETRTTPRLFERVDGAAVLHPPLDEQGEFTLSVWTWTSKNMIRDTWFQTPVSLFNSF